jgi:uncharacterized protein (DUF427 family)
MSSRRIAPGPGQESVWDYPRPPRLEPTTRHLVVRCGGIVLAETRRGWRVLETSHPPVYYFPPQDVQLAYLRPSQRSSYCEWKGQAKYWSVMVGDRLLQDVAWCYPEPTPSFRPIAQHLAFYAGPMDECLVDGMIVTPQPGGFYGGWITPDVVGPFKGEPGTLFW